VIFMIAAKIGWPICARRWANDGGCCNHLHRIIEKITPSYNEAVFGRSSPTINATHGEESW